jgi:UDP-N-acetylglucosamine 2-epimerase
MFDALLHFSKISDMKSNILERLNIKPKEYYLATIHRAENTDNYERLKNILAAFSKMDKIVVFPIHPRTKKTINYHGLDDLIGKGSIKVIDPVGYLDMLKLEKNAKAILTDSGGVQKEAFWLKVPCITLRDEIEWVETVNLGWNRLVGSNVEKILEAVRDLKFGVDVSFENDFSAKKMYEIIKKF